MGKLLELADRCEAATGADREVDGWAYAFVKGNDRFIIGNKPGVFPQDPIYGTRLDIMGIVKSGSDAADHIGAPHYTASLDAAMTLVDSRAMWAHGSMEEGPFARLCWPMPNGGYVGGYFEAKAKTVPLAICAAALRARAALSGKADDGGKG